MRLPRVRLTVRTMMTLVAVVAVLLAAITLVAGSVKPQPGTDGDGSGLESAIRAG